MVSKERYVSHVSNMIGYPDPPPAVREQIEQCYTEKLTSQRAVDYMLKLLRTNPSHAKP